MGNSSKALALLLNFIIVLSCLTLLTTEPLNAQSIPKPTVPEFTLKLVRSSYNVVDPQTGASHQIDNSSIEVRIKNQPFAYLLNGTSYKLYYNVRMKSDQNQNWTEDNPVLFLPNSPFNYTTQDFSRSPYVWGDPKPPMQTDSDYTLASQWLYLNSTSIDLQVEAIVGHNAQRWVVEHPLYPDNGGYYQPAIAYDSDSGWSSTQTITVPASSPSPSPTVPEFYWLVIVPLLLSLFAVIVVLRHRKNLATKVDR